MRLATVFVAVCMVLCGCSDGQNGPATPADSSSRTSAVSYVCVGMEVSGRFGSCPGCKLDADRMDEMLRTRFGYSGVLLQSQQATRGAVVAALRDAVARTPEDGLFIFYYSGHGGREFLNSTVTAEPDGADDADEYLCLYDKPLLDDDVWKIISPCRGRVFLVFDCCHSQTMFRSVASDALLAKGLAVPLESNLVKSSGFMTKARAVALGDGSGPKMLCWSGCAEAEYSYGSSKGGVMTNSIMVRWRREITYSGLWSMVVRDVLATHPTQHPSMTQYGGEFKEAFR